MKKFYMTMVAMLCGVAAMAQDAVMSAEPVDVKTDGTISTLVFKLALSDEARPNVQSVSVKFTLPEGVAVAKVYDEDEEEYKSVATCPMAKSSHTVMLVQGEQNPQNYVFAAMSTGTTTFKTATDVFAEIGLSVVGEIAKGDYEIPVTVDYASTATGGSVYPQDPFTVKLTVDGGTGINSINADDVNAPVYNIAGQRVSKAQKGVYIQNGKKVAVK